MRRGILRREEMTMKRITATLIMALIATPVYAMTAGDVLDKMTEKERAGYLAGAVEMAMYLAATAGQAQKSECISGWYFGRDARGQAQIVAAFTRYKDKPAVALMNALISKACPAN